MQKAPTSLDSDTSTNSSSKKYAAKLQQKRGNKLIHQVLSRRMQARLIASEYLRNGLQLQLAYETVTRKRWNTKVLSSVITSGSDFIDEINAALKDSDVEKNRVMALLWAMANISPLDYMDDEGVTLSIKDLKALPRELQALLEEVRITKRMVRVIDENGAPASDQNGDPVLREETNVKIKVASKQSAIDTIAKIGKMIGPSVVINNNYDIAVLMAESDRRAVRMRREVIDCEATEHQGLAEK